MMVTPHGMQLEDCDDNKSDLVAFISGSEQEYQKILDAGFESFNYTGEQVVVRVTGVFLLNAELPKYELEVQSAEILDTR